VGLGNQQAPHLQLPAAEPFQLWAEGVQRGGGVGGEEAVLAIEAIPELGWGRDDLAPGEAVA
jgi:hypothetical protein